MRFRAVGMPALALLLLVVFGSYEQDRELRATARQRIHAPLWQGVKVTSLQFSAHMVSAVRRIALPQGPRRA